MVCVGLRVSCTAFSAYAVRICILDLKYMYIRRRGELTEMTLQTSRASHFLSYAVAVHIQSFGSRRLLNVQHPYMYEWREP